MISFNSAPGNLFNILGKCGLLIKAVKTHQTAQKPNLIDTTNGLVAQLNANSDIQALVGSAYISTLSGSESACSLAQQVAQQVINRIVYNDNPRISQNLQSLNTLASLQEVIRQMKLYGASVLAMTITATPTAFTGVGNAIIIASTKRPFDGLTLENTFGETILFTCTSDSYSGGATAGNEGLTLTGVGSESDFFAFDWPLGSNATNSLNAIDGNTSNGSGNILTNSGFETWANVQNVPDNWTLVTGTASVNTFQESTLNYDGVSSLRITGDVAGTLTQIKQQFNSATGTSGSLSPLSQYSFNLFARRDGTAAGSGILTVDIADQNGTVLKDANNVANTFTIDLTTLTTVYGSFTGVFRTPVILPSQLFLRLRLTTALTNTRSVYLDKASLGLMTQLATSEPFFGVHAGSISLAVNDYATCVLANSRGSGGTLSTFQTLFAQIFTDMINSELLLPSSATPTISDSALIS